MRNDLLIPRIRTSDFLMSRDYRFCPCLIGGQSAVCTVIGLIRDVARMILTQIPSAFSDLYYVFASVSWTINEESVKAGFVFAR